MEQSLLNTTVIPRFIRFNNLFNNYYEQTLNFYWNFYKYMIFYFISLTKYLIWSPNWYGGYGMAWLWQIYLIQKNLIYRRINLRIDFYTIVVIILIFNLITIYTKTFHDFYWFAFNKSLVVWMVWIPVLLF